MGKPDGGMYGIKLILRNHLTLDYFTRDFGGADGELPLLNFSGKRIAALHGIKPSDHGQWFAADPLPRPHR